MSLTSYRAAPPRVTDGAETRRDLLEIMVVWEIGVAPIATADAKAALEGGSCRSYSTFFASVKAAMHG
jgi:hypothetical protein